MADLGIDISEHQGDIDLTTLKANGVKFAIIRVGYGISGTIDKKFKRNADLCKSIGLPVGFYWYSYALNVEGAEKEATAMINAITPYKDIMKYGAWFDMEDADNYKSKNGMPSNQVLREMCAAFCKKLEEAGFYAGVYASQSWFNNQLKGEELTPYDKWMAQWPTSGGKQKALNTDSASKTGVNLWQFTSQANIKGYSGNLDADYAYIDAFNNISDSSNNSEPVVTTTIEGTTLELAVEVMQGAYGDGDTRKSMLGSRYDEVQNFINHIFSADVNTLAQEVISGTYGDGDIRKTVLGSRYDEVQKAVNNSLGVSSNTTTITKGMKIKFTGTKSYSGISLASWTQNDTFDVIEVSGDRVVIGKGSTVTAAVKMEDCQVV